MGGRGEPQAWGLYLWNVALSEALYPLLHWLEVCLRNDLHQALTCHFGRPDWYDVPPREFRTKENDLVRDAKSRLVEQSRPTISPDDLVSELMFGFWVALMDRHYDRLWNNLLANRRTTTLFEGVPHASRSRHVIQKRFERIRRLRNRVFHHEPIWHWRDLHDQYKGLIEAIGWISRPAQSQVQALDRFEEVFNAGAKPFEQMVDQHCRDYCDASLAGLDICEIFAYRAIAQYVDLSTGTAKPRMIGRAVREATGEAQRLSNQARADQARFDLAIWVAEFLEKRNLVLEGKLLDAAEALAEVLLPSNQ